MDSTAIATTRYDAGLDKNPANFQPLTPLSFLERAARVFPDHVAIVHGLELRIIHSRHCKPRVASRMISARMHWRYALRG